MADATIPVTSEVKEKIDAEKRNGETYNRLMLRLLDEVDEKSWTEEEIEDIAERVFERKARRA